jgi:hypothetical protein
MKVILTEEQYRLLINESITIDNVKMYPDNPKYGGKLSLEYNGKKTKYSVNVHVEKLGITLYKGPIGVVNIWKKGNEVWVIDNTKKMFKLDDKEMNKIVKSAKTSEHTIYFAGTGEVNGVSGDYKATLTKV